MTVTFTSFPLSDDKQSVSMSLTCELKYVSRPASFCSLEQMISFRLLMSAMSLDFLLCVSGVTSQLILNLDGLTCAPWNTLDNRILHTKIRSTTRCLQIVSSYVRHSCETAFVSHQVGALPLAQCTDGAAADANSLTLAGIELYKEMSNSRRTCDAARNLAELLKRYTSALALHRWAQLTHGHGWAFQVSYALASETVCSCGRILSDTITSGDRFSVNYTITHPDLTRLGEGVSHGLGKKNHIVPYIFNVISEIRFDCTG